MITKKKKDERKPYNRDSSKAKRNTAQFEQLKNRLLGCKQIKVKGKRGRRRYTRCVSQDRTSSDESSTRCHDPFRRLLTEERTSGVCENPRECLFEG